MKFFVEKNSIVRKIWGTGDTILFIFAGAAAEFALNKAVDWLYFTGRLPADPLGRLFSTITYARQIVFSEYDAANKAIDKITAIHKTVEENRHSTIPDWAYRDVLFMLIHYSIASFELLERKLTPAELQEAFDVFYRVGTRMGIKDLPTTYEQWLPVRNYHLDHDMLKSHYTIDLFKQYKKHLGAFRYHILLQSQKLVVPPQVKKMLGFNKFSWMAPIIPVYKIIRLFKLDWLLKSVLLPSEYKAQIKALDIHTA